jgi:hypothetical protein
MVVVFGAVAVAVIGLLAAGAAMLGPSSPKEKSADTRDPAAKNAGPAPRPRDLPPEAPKPAAPASPSVPKTALDPKPAPPPPPDVPKAGDSMEDLRNQIGAARLADARAYHLANPDDPGAYRDRLEDILRTYRSTPAGAEAEKLMAGLKIPGDDEPPPNEADWRQAVNLLPLLDPQKDAVKGGWKVEGDKLTVQQESMARIEIPYEPPEEYDFRVTFVRSSGNEDVNQSLTHAGRSFFWSMGCEKNTGFGFDQVDGQNANRNRTLARKENAIENDRSYTSIVQVRKYLLRAWLDGQLVCRFRTNYKNLGMRKDWVLRSGAVLGLGAHSSAVTFQRIQLREVTGKGRPTRP